VDGEGEEIALRIRDLGDAAARAAAGAGGAAGRGGGGGGALAGVAAGGGQEEREEGERGEAKRGAGEEGHRGLRGRGEDWSTAGAGTAGGRVEAGAPHFSGKCVILPSVIGCGHVAVVARPA